MTGSKTMPGLTLHMLKLSGCAWDGMGQRDVPASSPYLSLIENA